MIADQTATTGSDAAGLPPDWPHRNLSRFVAIDNLVWHVQVGGQGPVILLLHGTGASAHSFADVVSELLGVATVVVPDLPGHGFTTGARVAELTLPAIAAQLERLLAALSMEQVDVVAGHSAGAPLALRWALNRSRGPRALIGFNPALIAPPMTYTQLIAPLIVPVATSRLVAQVMAQIAPASGMINRLLDSTRSRLPEAQKRRYATLFGRPSHVQGAIGLMAAADLPGLLVEARHLQIVPHFVLGDHDDWIPGARLRPIINANFPTAVVDTWPGGHLLHEADPERAARLLRDVCATVNRSSAS